MDRFDWILKYCAGRKVLHVGFADYPYHEKHLHESRLLHAAIVKIAGDVWGFDGCPSNVFEFYERNGFSQLLRGNAEELGDVDLRQQFDVVVAGELVEHLSNPGRFFRGIRRHLRPDGKLLVTVPNAFALKSFLRILAGKELVHPDHVSYLSPTTLGALGNRHGFEVDEMGVYLAKPQSMLGQLALFPSLVAVSINPRLADGLVCAFRLDESTADSDPIERQMSASLP